MDMLLAVGSTVIVLKCIVPGNKRIAVYLLVYATRHHEFHPFVEYRIIVFPAAVNLLHLGYHALEWIERLAVPGVLDDRAGDYLLSCLGQESHLRTHQIEMSLAPQGDIEITCIGVGILPQVEMEMPVLGSRQRLLRHLQREGYTLLLSIVFHRQFACVFPCLGIGWHTDVQPHRTCRMRIHLHFVGRIQTIGQEQTVLHVAAHVAQHIAHEKLAYAGGGDDVLPALQVAHGETHSLDIYGSREDSLS